MSKEILIEFYDEVALENIVSLEQDRYAKVIYLYFADAPEPKQEDKDRLRRFIEKRCGIQTEFCPIHESSLAGVCAVFDELLRGRSGVIDMTGGPELFSAAAGYYVAQENSPALKLQQYDIRTGKPRFCHPATECSISPLALSIKEAVALQGAVVMGSHPYDCEDEEMERQILRLWDAVKDKPSQWNAFCSLPGFSGKKKNKYQKKSAAESNRFEKNVTAQHEFYAYETVLTRLRRMGIVRNETRHMVDNKKYRSFTLDVPQRAKMLYRKGGNLLEMYCALAACRSLCFTDCHVSVELDWDSEVLRSGTDVRNEVDVAAMLGPIPVLISCKNTKVENEYLYEIMTMAKHYGGRYARAAVVSSVESEPSVRLRAQEMGIALIDNVQALSLDEFTDCFRRHFSCK